MASWAQLLEDALRDDTPPLPPEHLALYERENLLRDHVLDEWYAKHPEARPEEDDLPELEALLRDARRRLMN